MAMTKVYSVYVIGGAAVLSIICSFIGKMTTLISTIPGPVIGGISFLLYGMIGASGIRILVDAQVDYGKSRNQAIRYRSLRHFRTARKHSIDRYGTGLCCWYDHGSGILYSGQTETDER